MLYFCFVFTELRQQPFLSNASGHQCSHDSPSLWNEWARSSLELLGLSRTFLPWLFPVFAGCFGTRRTNYMNRGFSSPVLPRYLLLGMQEKWSDATRERWRGGGGGVWAGAMLARKQGSRFRNKGRKLRLFMRRCGGGYKFRKGAKDAVWKGKGSKSVAGGKAKHVLQIKWQGSKSANPFVIPENIAVRFPELIW